MSSDETSVTPEPIPNRLAEQLELLRQIRDALTAPAVAPQMLDADQAAAYCGLSRSALYRLVSGDQFPRPVQIAGVGPRWRLKDLAGWIEKLPRAPRRRSKVTTSEPAGE